MQPNGLRIGTVYIVMAMDIKQMNLDQARFNMVEQQIRTWEVLDQ